MNNPNPFLPQGSLAEQKNQKRARLKTAVFSILGINFALVAGVLLIQGCGGSTDKKVSDSGGSSSPTNDTLTTPLANNTTPTNVTSLPLPPETANNTPAGSSPVAATPGNITSTPPAGTLTATTGTTPLGTPNSTTTTMAPLPPIAPAPAPAGTTTEYVVAKGDSFSSIAHKVHVSSKAIMAANPGVVPTKLKAGQKIQIPAASAPAPMVASAATTTTPSDTKDGTVATAPAAPTGTYVVKAHDTLTKIAHVNNTTVKALRAENHMKTDAIRVGDKLKLPVKGAPVSSASTDTTPMTIPSAPVLAVSNVTTPVSTTAPVTTH